MALKSRLFQMVKARGYQFGPDDYRRVVGHYRPLKPAEAFQRLETLAGEQAQVDWAHFGKVQVARAERVLWAFVMVLSFSRQEILAEQPRSLRRLLRQVGDYDVTNVSEKVVSTIPSYAGYINHEVWRRVD